MHRVLFLSAGFTAANLTDADVGYARFDNARLTGANFAGADVGGADFRGAQGLDLKGVSRTNSTIMPDGQVDGFLKTLSLQVHDVPGNSPAPIRVNGEMHLGGVDIYFDADDWESTIGFAPGIPMFIDGGTLRLFFEDGVDVSQLIGRTYRLFDWTGVTPDGLFKFSGGPYQWDTSRLYTDGLVTLVPEPTANTLIGAILILLPSVRRRIIIPGANPNPQ